MPGLRKNPFVVETMSDLNIGLRFYFANGYRVNVDPWVDTFDKPDQLLSWYRLSASHPKVVDENGEPVGHWDELRWGHREGCGDLNLLIRLLNIAALPVPRKTVLKGAGS